jgi:hypothetical protein
MATREQKASSKQERRVAEELGGRTQKGSGSQWFAKGDVRVPGHIRIECKTTSQRFYSLKLKDLQKIRKEALSGMDEDWALQVQFQGAFGMNRKFAVIDWNTVTTLDTDPTSFHRELASGKSFSFSHNWMATHPRVALTWTHDLGAIWTVAIMPWDLYVNTPRRSA